MWPYFLFAHHLGYHMPSSRRCVLGTYLSVSGPLDFRLVIQVLLRPCMILNACVHRRHPCLTSLAEDVALPQEQYTHIHTAHARAGNRTRTVVWGGRDANRYTIGPAYVVYNLEHAFRSIHKRLYNVKRIQCIVKMYVTIQTRAMKSARLIRQFDVTLSNVAGFRAKLDSRFQ